MDYREITEIIKNSKKQTPVKAIIGKPLCKPEDFHGKWFNAGETTIIIGEPELISSVLATLPDNIDYLVECDRRRSAIPLKNLTEIHSRIEPGSFIREGAEIGVDCVIMMGAVVNIGAVIGDRTMLDMNCVIGARAMIGQNCHIGAGAVIAGVLEPPSATPVIIENDVVIGANAVILEGITIGKGSVIGAGSVVIKNVPSGVVAAGTPAKVIKSVEELDSMKHAILDDLRG